MLLRLRLAMSLTIVADLLGGQLLAVHLLLDVVDRLRLGGRHHVDELVRLRPEVLIYARPEDADLALLDHRVGGLDEGHGGGALVLDAHPVLLPDPDLQGVLADAGPRCTRPTPCRCTSL